jgi:hypothetical protein
MRGFLAEEPKRASHRESMALVVEDVIIPLSRPVYTITLDSTS